MDMTPDGFRAWRGRMAARLGSYSQADAARALGLSRDMVKRYERHAAQLGVDPPHPIPRAISLACAALEAGLEPE